MLFYIEMIAKAGTMCGALLATAAALFAILDNENERRAVRLMASSAFLVIASIAVLLVF